MQEAQAHCLWLKTRCSFEPPRRLATDWAFWLRTSPAGELFC